MILDNAVPSPKVVPIRPPPQLAALMVEAAGARSIAAVHRVLRQAVEYARGVIQLERAAIFLVDAKNGAMVGTWGTDEHGETVDEHHIMYELGDGDRAVFDGAQQGQACIVLEDCPLVTQLEDETRVIGRGWIACTAIQGPRGPIGIFFNDAALSGSPVDEAKQARLALLCSFLGHALDRYRRQLLGGVGRRHAGLHPLVRKVTAALAADPTLTCEQLGKRVQISAGRLARTFKKETHTSVVHHRNELRLSRFLDRLDQAGSNLLDAALEAGFGSYAQFHRVFRARFGQGPRAYFAARSRGLV